MKYKFILLLLFVAAFCSSGIRAQVKQVTIIDNLETPAPGEGNIKIISDPKITELIGLISPELSVDQTNYVKTSGFRVQVFMSNNSRTAKKEMMDKGSLIKGAFPDIATYQGYDAPNWKLLVGDFRTRDEADIFRKQLQKTIPELGKEMYIVRDKINIPIQK
jgi:hypothetical protein